MLSCVHNILSALSTWAYCRAIAGARQRNRMATTAATQPQQTCAWLHAQITPSDVCACGGLSPPYPSCESPFRPAGDATCCCSRTACALNICSHVLRLVRLWPQSLGAAAHLLAPPLSHPEQVAALRAVHRNSTACLAQPSTLGAALPCSTHRPAVRVQQPCRQCNIARCCGALVLKSQDMRIAVAAASPLRRAASWCYRSRQAS
jgi:hypothetical protein